MHRLFGGDVQLVPEFAQVGDPYAQHASEADLDVSRGAERERLVRQIGVGERLQQRSRQRTLQVDLGEPGRHVGDERVVRVGVASQSRLDVAVRGVGGHHEEVVGVEFGDREVGLERSGLAQPLRVRDPPGLAVHCVGRQLVDHGAGVAALHPELRHERHVHHDHALAAGTVLGGPLVPERRTSPREWARVGRGARTGVPIGALPAADVLEERSLGREPIVQR